MSFRLVTWQSGKGWWVYCDLIVYFSWAVKLFCDGSYIQSYVELEWVVFSSLGGDGAKNSQNKGWFFFLRNTVLPNI